MSRDCLLLNLAYIYQNLDTEDYLFMWFPLGEECADKEFQNLTEYILPRIDHQDEAAVTMGYSVYKEAVEIGLKTERIKEHIYGGMQEKKESRKEDSGDGKIRRRNGNVKKFWIIFIMMKRRLKTDFL